MRRYVFVKSDEAPTCVRADRYLTEAWARDRSLTTTETAAR